MLALKKVREGYGNMELVDAGIPRLEKNEVLMKVWAAGVCGSDLMIQEDRHFYKAPVTIGHEYSGVVEAVGSDVTKVAIGDKIVSDIETKTGWIGVTRDGSYASYVAIPQEQVYVFPKDASLDHMCFAEPVVATLHAMQERNNVKAGDFVTVVGPGPMGLLGVQFCKAAGGESRGPRGAAR